MRETVGIPAGALVYPLSIIFLLLAVKAVVAVPAEWSYLLTALIAIISFQFTCAIVKTVSTELGVKVVGVLIAVFWLISLGFDAFGFLDSAVDFLGGSNETNGSLGGLRDLVERAWDSKICAGVSTILALWKLAK